MRVNIASFKRRGVAALAQLVEQSLRKRWVRGSSPLCGTILLPHSFATTAGWYRMRTRAATLAGGRRYCPRQQAGRCRIGRRRPSRHVKRFSVCGESRARRSSLNIPPYQNWEFTGGVLRVRTYLQFEAGATVTELTDPHFGFQPACIPRLRNTGRDCGSFAGTAAQSLVFVNIHGSRNGPPDLGSPTKYLKSRHQLSPGNYVQRFVASPYRRRGHRVQFADLATLCKSSRCSLIDQRLVCPAEQTLRSSAAKSKLCRPFET